MVTPNNAQLDKSTLPDISISVRQMFGLDSDLQVPAFSQRTELVPDLDESYRFDHDTTMAILAGFAFNRRVMIQGYHGTGKSTHIEQVAARLNWPCIRINLDSHISRIDLIGKDAIVLKDGKILSQDSDVAEGFQRVSVELAHSLLGRSLKTNFTSFRAALKNWYYGDTPLVDLYDEMVEDLRTAA